MEPRLVQQQSQRLVLSPQIRQYLRLLQMPVTDLAQAVDLELTQNPLLEEKNAESSAEDFDTPTSDGEVESKASSEELRFDDTSRNLKDLDDDFRENYSRYDYSQASSADLQRNKDFQESLITRPEALSDYLLWQIRFMDLKESEIRIAEELVGNIDEQGFLQATVEEVAEGLQVPPPEVESVLGRLQQLEPPGVGARDLQEALLIQLRRRNPPHELAVKMVKNHLVLLEKRDWAQMARAINAPVEEVKKAAEIITRLEPRPGRSFYTDEAIAVTPDAVITFSDEGPERYRIEITHEKIPRLRINAYYRRLIRDKNIDAKTKEFVRGKLQEALDFMKAIRQRKSTLREITEQIVKEQPDFFEKGFSHLKPLRLKDIAENLGVHESTVSRAIQGKYIQTPQGTIPYRSFFSSKLETSSGEAESQRSIMFKIKSLVEKEDPSKPLSDQALLQLLKQDGIMIARRTIAKYRDLLRILPSHLRRKR